MTNPQITEAAPHDGMRHLVLTDCTGAEAHWLRDPAGVWFRGWGAQMFGALDAVEDYITIG